MALSYTLPNCQSVINWESNQNHSYNIAVAVCFAYQLIIVMLSS